MPIIPPSIILGGDQALVVFRENTHLDYNNGFSLYPMHMTLPTTNEVWALSTSNADISSVSYMPGHSDAIWVTAAVGGKKGQSTITIQSTYNNYDGTKLNTNVMPGTVLGDYEAAHSGAGDDHVLITGIYVGSQVINFQEASDAIIPTVEAGEKFTVFLDGDGTVWAWGSNDKGQLGQRTTTGSAGYIGAQVNSTVSTATPNPQRILMYAQGDEYLGKTVHFKAIAAGTNHGVALAQNGMVYTWGDNTRGQLGNGTSGGSQLYAAPVLKGKQTTASYVCSDGHVVRTMPADGLCPESMSVPRVISAVKSLPTACARREAAISAPTVTLPVTGLTAACAG